MALFDFGQKRREREAKQAAREMVNRGIDLYESEKFEEAFSLFQKAAQTGDIAAWHCIGVAYYEGKGATGNKKEAYRYFQKAAEAGYEPAAGMVTRMQQEAEQVKIQLSKAKAAWNEKDYDTCFALLKPLAEYGNPVAQGLLAGMYVGGRGVQ